MKTKSFFTCISIYLLFILFCSNHLQSQDVVSYVDNDLITDTLFFENGMIKNIRIYNNDMSLMYVKLFDKNRRTILAEGKYLNQQKDSVWNIYSVGDFILNRIEYKNDKKNGLEYTFYPNGEVAEIKEWKDDVQHGVWKQYFMGGVLKTDATYFNGSLEGKITYYHHNSKPLLGGVYQNGLREGKWIYFDEEGNIVKEENYKDGFLIEDIQ
ncbi:MAG: toxin-antitoxin system YwqK family antitoxin [Bacteroidales bacterium]|jgi:antitoxin component YwqK of YwqJK toxin-antitoxin module